MDFLGVFKKRKHALRQYRNMGAGAWKAFIKGQFSEAKLIRNVSMGMLGVLVVGTLVATLAFALIARELPRPDKIVRKEGFATKILDKDGQLLYEVYADQQRTPITIDQVPDYLKKATIAIEDKNFYTHGGFDPQGYLRIIWNVVVKRRLIGGSTLTQQLVKNVLLTSERKITRKVKEFILATQIESKYNKDEILQMYLNEAPYGGTAWGVATAAQIYFGKTVPELNLLESAILAGLPQRPSYFSPISGSKEAFKARTKDVLRRMREDGYITREMENQALQELEVLEIKPQLTSIKAPHFVMYVKEQLEEMYGQNLVEQGGLKVTTTLDLELQQKAQTIVSEEINKIASSAGIGNGAAMVMDPNTGNILGMVGSKDFFAKDYDGQVNVTQSLRQPGSTIKPITYVTAFRKGFTPASMIMDVPTEFPGGDGKPYKPQNYDGKYHGPVSMRYALASSLNIPAVKTLAMVGIENMMQTGFDMGLNTLEPTTENLRRFGLAVTLGGGEVKLIDLTGAYSAFANGGLRVEPVSILKVEDRNGRTLYEHKQVQGKRVLTEGEAFLMNHVLSDNNARLLTFGPNSYLNMSGRAIAVKTGTTNDKRDNWTIGWSRSLVVGVWVGNNDNSPMKNVASGVTGASPIWRRIILEGIGKYKAEDWKVPDEVEAVRVDEISGYPEHDGYPARADYVIKGTLPPLPDPIHTKVKLCLGQEKLASELDIARGEIFEKEFLVFKEDFKLANAPPWQDGINEWLNGQGDGKYHPPTEYCSSSDDIIVGIEEPGNEKDIEGTEVKIRVKVTSQSEIEKVEIYINGSKKETLVDRPYETTMNLSKGKYTIKAKAYRKDGKTAESGDVRIGTGGMKWNENDSTPIPSPSPTASPTPLPTP